MGEWAQMRSRKSSSSAGWSAYGGQVLGAYYPQQDPGGSSSGSAVAPSVGLALGALGTETCGSIVLPAEKSNIVGIKPTLGLTSRSMVIPISLRQDTVGPMARTVKDAAYMLTAISGKDKHDNWTSAQPFDQGPDYIKACNYSAFKGARLGVTRNGISHFLSSSTEPVMAAFEEAVGLITGAGAKVVEDADFEYFDPPAFHRNSSIVLDTDFVAGVSDYLSLLEENPNKVYNLRDLAHFTRNDPREEYPDRDVSITLQIAKRCISETLVVLGKISTLLNNTARRSHFLVCKTTELACIRPVWGSRALSASQLPPCLISAGTVLLSSSHANFGQNYVWDRELNLNITNESPESYDAYQANLRMAEEQGVVGTLDKYNLDALVMPTFASFQLPAIAGLPVITVPLGFYSADTALVMNPKGTTVSVAPNIPFGIAFIGRRWSEETLIALAYAFEQRTMTRQKMRPYINPTFELGDQRSDASEAELLKSDSAWTMFETMQAIFKRTMAGLLSRRGWVWAVLGMVETIE